MPMRRARYVQALLGDGRRGREPGLGDAERLEAVQRQMRSYARTANETLREVERYPGPGGERSPASQAAAEAAMTYRFRPKRPKCVAVWLGS